MKAGRRRIGKEWKSVTYVLSITPLMEPSTRYDVHRHCFRRIDGAFFLLLFNCLFGIDSKFYLYTQMKNRTWARERESEQDSQATNKENKTRKTRDLQTSEKSACSVGQPSSRGVSASFIMSRWATETWCLKTHGSKWAVLIVQW